MPKYQLIIGPDETGQRRTVEFEAKDAAHAFSFVEHHDDFVRAEIWQGEHLLCSVEASPDSGKVWKVNRIAIENSEKERD